MDIFDLFMSHHLLVYVEDNTTKNEMKQFEECTNIRFSDNWTLSDMLEKLRNCYIHKRDHKVTYSINHYDCYDDYKNMPYITLRNFLEAVKPLSTIKENEIIDLIGEQHA